MEQEIRTIKNVLENRVNARWENLNLFRSEDLAFIYCNPENYIFLPADDSSLKNFSDGILHLQEVEHLVLQNKIFWQLNDELITAALLKRFLRPDRRRVYNDNQDYSLALNYLNYPPKGQISEMCMLEITFSFSLSCISNPKKLSKLLSHPQFAKSRTFSYFIITVVNSNSFEISPRNLSCIADFLLSVYTLSDISKNFK